MKRPNMQTIESHEDKYYHIPKLALLPILGLIVGLSREFN